MTLSKAANASFANDSFFVSGFQTQHHNIDGLDNDQWCSKVLETQKEKKNK